MDNENINNDFLKKMEAYHGALALCSTYDDLNDLLKKQEEKITRQLNQAKRRNETLKKGNPSASTRVKALEDENILYCKLIHLKNFRIEFLNRNKDALKQLKTEKEEYASVLEKMND